MAALFLMPLSRVCGDGFSYASWTGDASSGISLDSSWAYSFGSADSTTIDGFPVTGVAGGSPAVAGRFSVSLPTALSGDTNDLTAQAGSGSSVVATSFVYGGNPGTITLEGLVSGSDYVVSMLSVGWESTITRTCEFSSGVDLPVSISQNVYGENKGIRVDYAFTADGPTRQIVIDPQTSDTWHLYGLALRQVKAPIVVTTVVNSGAGSLREALQAAQVSAGPDRIVFDASLDGQTILLASELATADADGVTVDASDLLGGIVLQGAGDHRGFFNTGTLILRGLTITGMVAPSGSYAGAVLSSTTGKLLMEDCYLTGNNGGTTGSSGGANFGGGLVNAGVATLRRCTIAGNEALSAGAIFNSPSGSLTLAQCTIAGNVTGTRSIDNAGIIRMRHCTVAANVGTAGSGAIFNRSGATLQLENSIIGGGNSGSLDLENIGTLIRVGANLAEWAPVNVGTSSGPAIIIAPPLLGFLTDNGGPAPTIDLLAGSPAIDAAVGSRETVDQRGAPRPFDGDGAGGAVADLGAVEHGVSWADIQIFDGPYTELADDGTPQVFGDTVVGNGTVRTFTLRNVGSVPLANLALSVAGDHPGDFTTSSLPATTLAVGASMAFDITFSPALAGDRSATVLLASNDPDENPFGIPVRGFSLAGSLSVQLGPAAPGEVIGWGDNTDDQSVPPAAAQSEVIAVSAGGSHTVALKSDGSVIAWGNPDVGQLEVPAAAESTVIAISAGDAHTLALKADGSVIAWGWNTNSQSNVPASAQSGVIAIAAGIFHSLALKENGSVVAWGGNGAGQSSVPAAALSGVIAIDAGGTYSLALKDDGSVIAWGSNNYGETTLPRSTQTGVVAIAAGDRHGVALKADGSVVVWGENGNGQATVPVAAQSGVAAIAAGGYHTMALTTGGSTLAWGAGVYDSGQTTVPTDAQSRIVALSAGFSHSIALRAYRFAPQAAGTASAEKTITLRNPGEAPLTISSVVLTGGDTGDFILNTTGMASSIPVGGETTLALVFAPLETGVTSDRTVTVRINSDDPAKGIYDFPMDSLAASFAEDSDGDGVSDGDEVRLVTLGFDYLIGQPQLAGIYNAARDEGEDSILDDPNAVGLYTTGQVQVLRVRAPLLQRVGPGQFSLRVGLDRSPTMVPRSYLPFPFTAPETSVNGSGELEFQFTLPDDAAFLRVETP
ncbi:regulator of chromosome condensation repeat-containing protein [Haloferula helveola]|uniref:Regulator of chromosome condensation repeat-containing protein n=1 Tax=Haloferula helveola TaxID=490095 RepID=A0ABM7RF77_9BACT|nr:regulator of chromosome condensation repeat-containing protein [Haloferula helveola]